MPKGPRGEKRPADVIGAAVKVMRIATGQESEEITIQERPPRFFAVLHIAPIDSPVAAVEPPS